MEENVMEQILKEWVAFAPYSWTIPLMFIGASALAEEGQAIRKATDKTAGLYIIFCIIFSFSYAFWR